MLTMQAGTSGAVAVVDVTGVIGWDDAQCLEFADKLKAAANQGASSITLRVNSPGGDVFSALSMYDAIRSCKMPVRAEVHGLAASAASLLCMAADTVAMSESAKFMVHQPYAGVWGNPDEIMNYAAMLIKEREKMFGIYGEKCGKSWEQVSNDHKASVYYSAAEAIAYGFVDEVIHDDESAGNCNAPRHLIELRQVSYITCLSASSVQGVCIDSASPLQAASRSPQSTVSSSSLTTPSRSILSLASASRCITLARSLAG